MRGFSLLTLGAALLALASPGNAQELAEPPPASELFEVVGIADTDLLNLRATASPGGLLIARIPNGTLLRNLGCADVSGVSWCKVSVAEDPAVMGWAAERYLQPTTLEPLTDSEPPAE